MGKHLVKTFSGVSLLAVKWLTDWQYLALTAARDAISGPLCTAIFSVVISTTASRDKILRRSPDVEFTSGSRTQLRDVIWIKYISTTTEEM